MVKELKNNVQELKESPVVPFTVIVGNLRAYTEGDWEDILIDFPQNEENIQKLVEKATDEDSKTMIVLDIDYREDCRYMRDFIGEFLNQEEINELNTIAKLIGDEPHPAVETYLQNDSNLSLTELANLFVQESEIPYYPYKFEGSDNPELMERLSEEEKMGYSYIESFAETKLILENLQFGEMRAKDYIDVEAVGRDLSLSGDYLLTENGYYNARQSGPDLETYTMDKIKEGLAEREVHLEKGERIQQDKKGKAKEQQSTPHISPSL